jgi:hypothetical protein
MWDVFYIKFCFRSGEKALRGLDAVAVRDSELNTQDAKQTDSRTTYRIHPDFKLTANARTKVTYKLSPIFDISTIVPKTKQNGKEGVSSMKRRSRDAV